MLSLGRIAFDTRIIAGQACIRGMQNLDAEDISQSLVYDLQEMRSLI